MPDPELIGAVPVAVAEWTALLGAGAVQTDARSLAEVTRNTSEHAPREVVAVLRPSSAEDVERTLVAARRHGVPLHPVSSGRNWGFGSALPVKGPVALVDLRRLDRIVVDERLRCAVIESGVTQGQLSEHLAAEGGALKLNVTGAGPDTSIVGNLLERGGGNLGARADDLLGLEVVLGSGEVVRTGFWHLSRDGHPAAHYPAGLGPDLRGLFVQSNFGIVTRLVVRLHPVSPLLELAVEVEASRLAELVEALRRARDDGLVTGYLRICDGTDPMIRFFPSAAAATWKAQLTVTGLRALRRAARAELERRLRPLVQRLDAFDCDDDDLSTVDDVHRTLLEARLELANGTPSHRSLERIAASVGRPLGDLDRDDELPGFLCVNVVLPFTGEHVVTCSELVAATAGAAGFDIARFYGMVGPLALSGFFPWYFDRRDRAAVASAHALKDELLQVLELEGIFPMRLDIDSIGPFVARSDDGYWRTVGAIKRALDPDGVISPGRYA